MSGPAAATTSHGEGFKDLDDSTSKVQEKQEEEAPPRFEEGTDNAHSVLDKTDERSIKNQLAAAKAAEKAEKAADEAPPPLPTAAAKAHGNEPSRGAKIDEQIMLEEQAELERKGKA